MNKRTEYDLHKAVADYLRLKHILFHSDTGSGVKLTKGQAAKMKAIQGGRGWPDIFIAEPIGYFHGLFIELKLEGTRLRKKNGEWASEHIREQAEVLEMLQMRGYKAVFCVGIDEAIKVIDEYCENPIQKRGAVKEKPW